MAGPRALLLLLLITLIFECVSAGKKVRPCKFNRKKYEPGQVIANLEDNCLELRCSNAGKIIDILPAEGCTCSREETGRVNIASVDDGKKKKPCKYNRKKYEPGQVIASLEDNCLELRCSNAGKIIDILPVEGCTCSREGAETTTEPSTEPPTDPPNPTTDCDWSQFGLNHTMNLPPNAECGTNQLIGGVSDIDKETILRKHNELREKVAKGLETQGLPGPQPSAANMLEMRWNSQLAEVAQAWVEQCSINHDDDRRICDPDYTVGQNLMWAKRYKPETEWENFIETWYNEVEKVNASDVESFPRKSKFTHYTQIVWAQTYEVGCGAIHYVDGKYPHAKIYVCNYGPMGNTYDAPVYIEGAAASQCPGAISADYPGLCATN